MNLEDEKKEVDHVAFAEMMVRRAELQKAVDEIERQIIEVVMQLEETQKIANVEAKYSKPSDVYDYKEAFNTSSSVAIVGVLDKAEALKKHTTRNISESVSWKKACAERNLLDDLKPSKIKAAKVTITVKG